jgi:hypothetical protein
MANDKQKIERAYAVSAKVGELLQAELPGPLDGVVCLMMCLGRVYARQAFDHLNKNSAWRSVQKVKFAFDLGFAEERATGHKGVPTPGAKA